MPTQLFAALAVACVVAASPGQSQATRDPQQDALRRLQSADPLERVNAYYDLKGTKGGLARAGASGALLRALDREDRFVYQTLEEFNMGTSDKYGEGYSEYVAVLWDDCTRYCNRNDPAFVAVFADGPLLSSTPFMEQLAAEHGPELFPRVMELAKPGKFGRQIQAVQMLGTIARFSRTLSPAQRKELDSALISAAETSQSVIVPGIAAEELAKLLTSNLELSDAERLNYHSAVVATAANKYTNNRMAAAEALGNIHDPADVPLLRAIAARDTAKNVNYGRVTYPVREVAAKALAKMAPPSH